MKQPKKMIALVLYLIPKSYALPKYHHGLASVAHSLRQADCIPNLFSMKELDHVALSARIKGLAPDLILISYSSNKRSLAESICQYLAEKHPSTPLVVGGIHPTADPIDAVGMPGVDAACHGAGEKPVCEIVERLRQGRTDFSGIPNLYTKDGGRALPPTSTWNYVHSGDEIPSDYKLFDLREEVEKTGRLAFMAGRGCVFRCSYCIHSVSPIAFTAYPVSSVISQIKRHIKHVGLEVPCISFHDDLFPTRDRWLSEFSERYATEVGIPFYCQMTASSINERVATQLKNAGCFEIRIGVESGCEERRRTILNKNISNERFIRARNILRDKGIRVVTLFMIGAPYETHNSVRKMFEFTRELSPEETRLSIFQPYPGSQLYDMCIAEGWIDGTEFGDSLYEVTTQNIPHISPAEIYGYFNQYQAEFKISDEA